MWKTWVGMGNSVLGIIYFIAFSHAVMLAVSLWSKTTSNSPARLLAVLTALIAYKLFEGGALYSGFYHYVSHSMDLLPGEVLSFGPLYYLYVCKVSGERPFLNLKWLLHFIPAALIWLYNSPSVFRNADSKIAMWDNVLNAPDGALLAVQWVVLLLAIKTHLAIYLLFSWQRISQWEKEVDNIRADDSRLLLIKMRVTVVAFFLLEVVWVGLFLGKQYFGIGTLNAVSEVWLLFVAFVVLALGFIGLQSPKLVFDQEEKALAESHSVVGLPLRDPENLDDKIKYLHSSLPGSTLAVLAKELETKLKEQQLYLSNSLTITDLSKATGIRSHTLSQIITQCMNTNFYKLINGYRVQHAVALIEDKSKNWPLERIALESGFGNRVTFSKSFKETMSCTPSAYKKQVAKVS